jgi:hypothetical protein
VGSFP